MIGESQLSLYLTLFYTFIIILDLELLLDSIFRRNRDETNAMDVKLTTDSVARDSLRVSFNYLSLNRNLLIMRDPPQEPR